MSDQQRDAAADLAVCEAATPGPWVLDGEIARDLDGDPIWAAVGPGGHVALMGERVRRHPCDDADLILAAMAREALPWWIAEAERLRALLLGDGGSFLSLDADGLRVKHWAVRVLAESLADSLGDAPNFFQVEVTHPEQGQLVVTIRRKGGKTPEGLEVEQLRAENAHLQRSNEVMGEEWREGLSTTWDCIRLIRRALAEGMTPELQEEMSAATTFNVHGESGQVEQLQAEIARLRALPSPTALLEAWAAKDERRDYQISKNRVILMQFVSDSEGMLRDVSAMARDVPAGIGASWRRVYLGRDATTAEMILAALAKWQELYGAEKE